jgi:hypothetical protein
MKPKEEYVIIVVKSISFSTHYGYYHEGNDGYNHICPICKLDNGGAVSNTQYSCVPYGLCTKFSDLEQAQQIAVKIRFQLAMKSNIFTTYLTAIDVTDDIVKYPKTPNDDTITIWVIKVPLSYYIGEYYAWAKSIYQYCEEHNFYYTNDKRYQIERHDEYLIAENGEYQWTKDRFKASLFTKDEQDKLAVKLNEMGRKEIPYLGYCRENNLPCYLKEKPRFEKGDVAYFFDSENYKIRKVIISDILPSEYEYKYGVSSSYFCGNVTLPQEHFFESNRLFKDSDLYTLDEVKQRLEKYKNTMHGYRFED